VRRVSCGSQELEHGAELWQPVCGAISAGQRLQLKTADGGAPSLSAKANRCFANFFIFFDKCP
jgi:hypothetical protein